MGNAQSNNEITLTLYLIPKLWPDGNAVYRIAKLYAIDICASSA